MAVWRELSVQPGVGMSLWIVSDELWDRLEPLLPKRERMSACRSREPSLTCSSSVDSCQTNTVSTPKQKPSPTSPRRARSAEALRRWRSGTTATPTTLVSPAMSLA